MMESSTYKYVRSTLLEVVYWYVRSTLLEVVYCGRVKRDRVPCIVIYIVISDKIHSQIHYLYTINTTTHTQSTKVSEGS